MGQYTYIKLHKDASFNGAQGQTNERWPQSKLHSAAELRSPQYQAQYRHWSESHFRQGALTDEQRAQLISLIEKEPPALTPVQNRFARAILYFYQKDYDQASAQAARCASGGLQLCSELLRFYCHIYKKEFSQARQSLSRLTALFPDSENVLDAVDVYHFEVDKRQDGIVEIQALLAKNPRNTAALFELAKIYSDLSESTDALKYCDLALKLNPKSTKFMLLKANILTSQKEYAEGLKTLAAVVAMDHQNGPAYFARAAIYTQEGRWPDAIGDLTKAIQLRYDLCKSLQARAACYSVLKKFDLARQDLSQVKSIDSGANLQRLPGE